MTTGGPSAPGSLPGALEAQAPGEVVLYAGPARHSVRLGAYVAWICAWLGLTLLGGVAMKVETLAPYPVWAVGFAALPGLLWTYVAHATTRYRVTTRRVEFERGVLGKDVDSLELWRVLDVTFKQTLWDRMLGNARITLVGTDRTHPSLVLHGLPEPRPLFERLRDAVQAARYSSRPMELVGPGGAEVHEIT